MAPLKYQIHYARVQTELELNEKESSKALEEMFNFLVDNIPNVTEEVLLSFDRHQVGVLQLSQYFDIADINRSLEQKSIHFVKGALLSRIVTLINRKQLFGEKNCNLNFTNFIYEIYDPMFDDFCVLINPNQPIPDGSSIRVKINTIREMFHYTKNHTADIDYPIQSDSKKQVLNEFIGTQKQVLNKKMGKDKDSNSNNVTNVRKNANTNSNGKVMIFTQSSESDKSRMFERRKPRGANRRKNRFPKFDSNAPASAPSPICTSVPFKYPSLTRAQAYLFKGIIKALRNETILREIDRDSRRFLRTSRKKYNSDQWLRCKLIESICKVMSVFYLLEDLRIPTKCICGICELDSTAIILARKTFRDKQIVVQDQSSSTNIAQQMDEVASKLISDN
ncbi:hypothetical protein RDWZM_009432 [Blomia tropicalis]|uniref:Uncharacterized protein n=1 Tax=Blomia tropicalis TaxID=40697 RepID=A0A9Q0RLB2_BLOTA|nr:hypothetical protein RDWZM_009432 [Blomia tropicalis]